MQTNVGGDEAPRLCGDYSRVAAQHLPIAAHGGHLT